MGGKPRGECKIVPEAVWARAKADYLNGMTAPAVAARYGVGVAGLRGRIAREGLTKAGHAAANGPHPAAVDVSDAPVTALAIGKGALRRASAALLAGRPAEAEAIVRVLGEVQSLAVHVAETEPEPEISLEEAMARNLRIARTMFAKAEELAEQLLGDGQVPQDNARWAFAWRQARLGAEAAARDRAYADRMGWTEWLYDTDGRLIEEEEDGDLPGQPNVRL